MSKAFRECFPGIKYSAEAARRKLFQLPLVSITVGNPSSGSSYQLVLEHQPGTDYNTVCKLLNAQEKSTSKIGVTKSVLKGILCLAQSDRERELIRYTAFVSGGFSSTSAKKQLGLCEMKRRTAEVEVCINEAQEIREEIDRMAIEELHSLAVNHGLSGSDDDDDDSDSSSEIEDLLTNDLKLILMQLLQESKYNWFEFISQVESRQDKCLNVKLLESFYKDICKCDLLSAEALELTQQSYLAFMCDEEQHSYCRERIARILNNEIVTDSDSDNPDLYHHKNKELAVKRKVDRLKRNVQKRKAKRIAERNYLKRSYSKRANSIVDKYPDIGESIEDFVKSCSIGADKWRRTGVLTFDGNVRVNQKATYQKIQNHLEKKYGQKFSYGTVVELCVARNKRRKSSKRYRGLANVTSRRARKGFTLRYNPDAHWSSALYRSLNVVQFTDGRDIININRDDAAGFRLDTLFTQRQYSSLIVKGKEILGTRTDYVNKYKSILQTSNYNFTATKTTGELCAGIVKAHGVFEKNPAQHASDLKMLLEKDELKPAFVNYDTGLSKAITCVRVDGASDEGPNHLEVQFWWTQYHLTQGNFITLVTSRSSGSSYLNRVELQNGCLAQAHSNVFIPSTLRGSCYQSDTGKIDLEKLKENLDCATDVYINRCNKCPCGQTVIHLYRGANSSDLQKLRPLLNVFLKGKKQQVSELKQKNPEAYSFFNKVWSVRNKHIVSNFPEQYIFFLRCCLQRDCVHPLCLKAQEDRNCVIPKTWFPSGPPVTYLPMPVQDPTRSWGRDDCTECSGFCHGHYMKPEQLITSNGAYEPVPPPSAVIQDFFIQRNKTGTTVTDSDITDLARRVLLPKSEVQIWLDHLEEVQHNRKRGAAQAAITRKAKKAAKSDALAESSCITSNTDEDYFCEVCGGKFEEITDNVESWIGCDRCDSWLHWDCAGISEEPKQFFFHHAYR